MTQGSGAQLSAGNATALYDQANGLQRAGRFADAVASYDQAITIKPDFVEALTNRGVALRVLGRAEDAVASFDRALALRPTYALALANRGNALRDLGRNQQALASYDRALVLMPGNADALINRGAVLHELGRYAEALDSHDRALTLRPGHPDALIHRANALLALKQPADALEGCARALALRPSDAEALNVRGNALWALGRADEALASYGRALAVRPDHAGALYNRGNVLQTLDRCEEALADYDRARMLRPDHADTLNNRGNALLALRRNAEATADFAAVLALDPDYPYAEGKLFHARMRCADWGHYREQMAWLTAGVAAGSPCAMPFEFVVASDKADDQLRCARLWAAENCRETTPLHHGERTQHDRIRLAYLSADFHEHATAYLTAELFEQHDRTRFETIAVSYGPPSDSAMRKRLERAFDRFIDVRGMTDAEVAALLRELEVDIAVDLKGFTGGSRPAILASKPAPIQVNYLGYPGTMGMTAIDYIVADRFVIPEHQRRSYSEKVVTLPDSYAPNDSQRPIAEATPTRAELGLPENGFVFCSFNNTYKITPDVFDIWMRLLRAIDGSVLWLLASDDAAAVNLRYEAQARGVDPGRLVFAPRVGLADHLARHRVADLFLDTLPCNAHTTASDALWTGLPLVTCAGSTFAGRVAASLLDAAGLPELITHSLADYEALALKLARDADALTALKARLAGNRESCALFDVQRYRRHIEAAYLTMWQRHQVGEPPASFKVEPIAG